jgi:hypothetical protein
MPRISAFYGIVIWMYFDDHSPPHFHATYGEYEAIVEIATRRVLRGHLPARALRLVAEWAAGHEAELFRDWRLARAAKPLLPIDPLR